MKRAAFGFLSLSLGTLVLGVNGFATVRPEPAVPASGTHTRVAGGTLARAFFSGAARGGGEEDRAAVRRRIRSERAGTYIDDILSERDSAICRWPDRNGVPLTVWIQPSSPVAGFMPDYVARVREAFHAWDALGLPLHFAFSDDSANAEVHVNWIDHFNEPISGRTRWTRNDAWAITDADIVLAVHHSQGEQLDEDSMRAMALHEIGHLLGLDHTHDEMSVMAPRVRVRQLSDADRATVRLLYSLPVGPLR